MRKIQVSALALMIGAIGFAQSNTSNVDQNSAGTTAGGHVATVVQTGECK